MSPVDVIELTRRTLEAAFIVSAPVLAAAMLAKVFVAPTFLFRWAPPDLGAMQPSGLHRSRVGVMSLRFS
jgi:hypothetical protein